MIALTDAFALVSVAVALCAGAANVCRIGTNTESMSPVWFTTLTKAWVLSLFIAMLVPIPGTGIPFAGYFRGLIGDLSITLLALSVWSLCHRLFGVVAMRQRELTPLLLVICAAALLLYPTALGWGDWDAYRLGWGSWAFLAALLAISGISAWMGLRVLPALLALALLAWSSGLMESGNLWDYLLDPWLSAFAVGVALIKSVQTLFKRFDNRLNSRSSH